MARTSLRTHAVQSQKRAGEISSRMLSVELAAPLAIGNELILDALSRPLETSTAQ